MDYAQVQILGRATSDAKLYNIDNPEKLARAVFNIAINLPIRENGVRVYKAIFRTIVARGSQAKYIADKQSEGGLKGRLINILGSLDTEIYTNIDNIEVSKDVIKAERLVIMDRKIKENDDFGRTAS